MGNSATLLRPFGDKLEHPTESSVPLWKHLSYYIHPISQGEAINNSTKTLWLILTRFNDLKCAHLYKCIGSMI